MKHIVNYLLKAGHVYVMPLLLVAAACGNSGKVTTEAPADAPALQLASSGNVDRLYIYSPELGDTVTVDVWTPEGYDTMTGRMPVIYMHDGQNLFDASTTWNGQAWEIDSVVGALVAADRIAAPVVVGVHSVAATRTGDLMPQNVLKYMPPTDSEAVHEFMDTASLRGNSYAGFLVKTLKPYIDRTYRVAASADSTFVMGSSMGGLMSIYAMTEYPETFGGAARLSTHWIGTLDGDPAFPSGMLAYLADRLPRDRRHRLYLDHGTETLDSLYGEAEQRVIDLVTQLGYDSLPGESGRANLCTYIDEGGAHDERSWAARVERPLRFLLGKGE